jgi:hypothetical protein
MKYYFRLNQDNIIVDAITYPVDGYIEYETDYPLPAGINGGWWKLEGGMPVEHLELKPKVYDEEFLELKKQVQDQAIALAVLLGM